MNLDYFDLAKGFNRLKRLTAIVLTLAVLSLIFTAGSVPAQENDPMAQVDAKSQALIIDSVCDALNRIYVFSDVAKEMEKKVRQAYKKGEYKELTDRAEFVTRLSDNMSEICQDGHFGIRYVPNMDPTQFQEFDSLSHAEQERIRIERDQRLKQNNYNFKKLEILPGNIGYFKFDGFVGAELGGAKAVAAMNFFSDVDALIIDLRENGGGEPSMIQLITSYFFDHPVHLNSFYVRQTDSYEQFWTQACVQGPRLTNVDLYVLTSNYTFSGAEEFSYNLKNLKRATLIGETTGGGAHPVTTVAFPNLGVVVRVPYGRAINPISNTNWERVGVTPDIDVPADQALDVARENALEKLAHKENNHPTVQRILDWELESVRAKNNPIALDLSALQEFVGDFGPRHILIENGQLYYQRDERPKYRMIALEQDKFMLDGLDYFRLVFVRDEQGNITEIMGMYNDGHSDHTPRTN